MNDRDIEDTRQPKDEIEQEYCEKCYQPMEYHNLSRSDPDPYFECNNQFCPEKFEKYGGGTIAVVLDMSNHLVEVEETLKSTQDSLEYVRNSLAYVEGIRQEREKTIEYLEAQLDKHNEKVLTQSQVSLRDTEYQIRRMEDSFVNWGIEMSADAYKGLHDEWLEVKKILESRN